MGALNPFPVSWPSKWTVRTDQIATIHRFETKVLLVPPWPALCQSGVESPHDVATATVEDEALRHFHPALGFTITLAPQTSVAEKIAFILSHTATTASQPT
jgi:predicted ATPase